MAIALGGRMQVRHEPTICVDKDALSRKLMLTHGVTDKRLENNAHYNKSPAWGRDE